MLSEIPNCAGNRTPRSNPILLHLDEQGAGEVLEAWQMRRKRTHVRR
jgi:hypothetical protein